MTDHMIFETHAHFDDEAFDTDREALIASLPFKGISPVINVCSSAASLDTTLALAEKYPYIYGAFGFHPDNAAEMTDEQFQKLSGLCGHPKAAAVGEIGLDYYVPAWAKDDPEADFGAREESGRELQRSCFRRQLELARSAGLPVIIHSRDACRDTLQIAKETDLGSVGGVMHCFSYSRETAAEYLDMGIYLGIGGVVTFKNGRKLREIVEYMPLSQLLLETDCPYLAPEPKRGTRNSSLNLYYIAQKVAEIRGKTTAEIIDITRENAERCFPKACAAEKTGNI